MTRLSNGTPTIERLEYYSEKVSESGCQVWVGGLKRDGYGKIKVNRKMTTVHRVAYEAEYGKIPEGMHVLHRCDVRCCINPNHLFLGTNQDNVHDRVKKGRSADFSGKKNPNYLHGRNVNGTKQKDT